jgi:hypothetical protein
LLPLSSESLLRQPLGLMVKVGFRDTPLPELLVWPAAVAWARDTPLVFGDPYRESPDLAVEKLVIDAPAWDRGDVRLILSGLAPNSSASAAVSHPTARTGRVQVRFELPGDGIVEHPDLVWEAAVSELRVDGCQRFPHCSKWANGLVHIALLHLRMLSTDGTELWSGAYPYGFDHGLIVRERYGETPLGVETPLRPLPDNPDFVGAFRRYILGRLPDYAAQTTVDGASSDFFLKDRFSDHVLDLSQADALNRAADMYL